jgi:hypothetical protein
VPVNPAASVVSRCVVLGRGRAQPELGALAAQQRRGVEAGEGVDDFRHLRHCGRHRVLVLVLVLGIGIGIGIGHQLQERLSHAGRVPARDVRRVALGVAATMVDAAEDGGRVAGFHEGAGAIVDGLDREGHVVGGGLEIPVRTPEALARRKKVETAKGAKAIHDARIEPQLPPRLRPG